MKLIASVAATLVLLSGMAYAQTKPVAPATTEPAQHAASSAQPTAAAQSKLRPYQDSRLPVEQRITDLIQRMTLAEKLTMLGTDPTVPRLGIVGTNPDNSRRLKKRKPLVLQTCC